MMSRLIHIKSTIDISNISGINAITWVSSFMKASIDVEVETK